jgi:hypothetical protein
MLSFLRVLSLDVKTVELQEIIKRPLMADTQMYKAFRENEAGVPKRADSFMTRAIQS